MAVSIAQYVDLLFKKLQGVAKTANASTKSASNESIASPAFIRGDIVWMQSDEITSTAGAISGISNARINANSVECVADTTVPPISSVYPTWLSNVSYWIPQEFGPTWLPKVYVGPSGAANIQATGTQIFSAGIGGVGEYFFDTQAGVLNFIGETIPSVLTAGNVVYISGYQYVGAIGVNSNPGNITLGNLTVSNTTISTDLANGNITLAPTGTGLVTIDTTTGLIVPAGNIIQRPGYPTYSSSVSGTIRYNTDYNYLEYFDGTAWTEIGSGGGGGGTILDQQITPDGTSLTYTLTQDSDQASILVSFNGVGQIPGVAYTVSGNSITFAQVPETTDIVDIRFLAAATTDNLILNSSGNTKVTATDNSTVLFTTNNANVATITAQGIFNISAGHSLQLPSYTVANATALGNVATGQMIYVSNGASGSPCLAVYSGGTWKQVAIGNTITT